MTSYLTIMNVLESHWFTQITQLKEKALEEAELAFLEALECKMIIDLELLNIAEIEHLQSLGIKYLE